ncbi:MAG: hypothetical protein WDZ59_00900 [Pirellulales bacterium]
MATAVRPLSGEGPIAARSIDALLARLRRRIRLYVWIEGLASIVIALGVAFWAGLALDWLLEPSPAVRIVALAVVAAIVGVVAYRRLLRRAFVPLSDTSMALLLERRYRDFDESLLTVVELSRRPPGDSSYDLEMLRHTGDQAALRSQRVRLGAIFDPRPLLRGVSAAVLLVASIVAFGVFSSDAFSFWIDRIALTPEPWPRNTRLMVAGFEENEHGIRTVRVGRDGDLELIVQADLDMPAPPPESVEIRYRMADGARGRDSMTRIGRALPGRDEFQVYRYEFKDIVSDFTFDVVGGDDRVEGLQVEVVDRPQFVGMTLELTYPAYMQRDPRNVEVSGVMPVPEGTRLGIRAQANKPLSHVVVQDVDQQTRNEIEMTGAVDRQVFQYKLPPLDGDKLLTFLLLDDDGIQTREPYRLSLSMVADETPQVAVGLTGIGTSITPDARIPFSGKVLDDYALQEAWFEYQVDEGEPRRQMFEPAPAGALQVDVDQALDARDWNDADRLTPGQRLVMSVQATDRYDLAGEPHVGSSQRFLLDVVTPDQLRAMLEGREGMLRERFETIVAEMTETRDLLARVELLSDVDSPQPGSETDEEPSVDEAEGAEESATAQETALEDSADDTADQAARTEDADRQTAQHRLRVVRAEQNVQRTAHETLGVAAAFDEIREELINNRIDNEEVKRRLQDEIADPLKNIGQTLVPALEESLGELKGQIGDPAAGEPKLAEVLRQSDEVLVAMQQVLDKMLELEDYNEVIELLRGIIEEQQQLNERTQRRRRERLLEN